MSVRAIIELIARDMMSPGMNSAGASTDKLTEKQKKLENQLSIVTKTLSLAKQAWAGARQALGGLADVTLGITDRFSQHAVQTDRLATTYGSTIEKVSGLDRAFRASGASSQTMEMAMKGLIAKAREAGSASVDLGQGLGSVSVVGRDLTDVMHELADRFQQSGGGVRAGAAALKLFEEAGIQVLPILMQGSAELRRQAQLATDLGATYTKADSEISGSMLRVQGRIGTLAEAATNLVARALGPSVLKALEDLAGGAEKTFKEWADSYGGVENATRVLAQSIKTAAGPAVELLTAAINGTVKAAKELADGVVYLVKQFKELRAAQAANQEAGHLEQIQKLNAEYLKLRKTLLEMKGEDLDSQAAARTTKRMNQIEEEIKLRGGQVEALRDVSNEYQAEAAAIAKVDTAAEKAGNQIEVFRGSMSGTVSTVKDIHVAADQATTSLKALAGVAGKAPPVANISRQAWDGDKQAKDDMEAGRKAQADWDAGGETAKWKKVGEEAAAAADKAHITWGAVTAEVTKTATVLNDCTKGTMKWGDELVKVGDIAEHIQDQFRGAMGIINAMSDMQESGYAANEARYGISAPDLSKYSNNAGQASQGTLEAIRQDMSAYTQQVAGAQAAESRRASDAVYFGKIAAIEAARDAQGYRGGSRSVSAGGDYDPFYGTADYANGHSKQGSLTSGSRPFADASTDPNAAANLAFLQGKRAPLPTSPNAGNQGFLNGVNQANQKNAALNGAGSGGGDQVINLTSITQLDGQVIARVVAPHVAKLIDRGVQRVQPTTSRR